MAANEARPDRTTLLIDESCVVLRCAMTIRKSTERMKGLSVPEYEQCAKSAVVSLVEILSGMFCELTALVPTDDTPEIGHEPLSDDEGWASLGEFLETSLAYLEGYKQGTLVQIPISAMYVRCTTYASVLSA